MVFSSSVHRPQTPNTNFDLRVENQPLVEKGDTGLVDGCFLKGFVRSSLSSLIRKRDGAMLLGFGSFGTKTCREGSVLGQTFYTKGQTSTSRSHQGPHDSVSVQFSQVLVRF